MPFFGSACFTKTHIKHVVLGQATVLDDSGLKDPSLSGTEK